MLRNHVSKAVKSHVYISTNNPYNDFKPFPEHDTFIYSLDIKSRISFRDYFIKGVTNEQT